MIKTIVSPLILNNQQQSASDTLIEYILYNTDGKMCLLSGWAGTGKSTIINYVVNKVKELGYKGKFGMTATTNKAVRILKATNVNPILFEFGTIHSFCGLVQEIQYNGNVVYKPDFASKKELKIRKIDVLIVDEASMLNKELFTVVHDYSKKYGFKVIFVGDAAQLPPINEKIADPFLPSTQKSHNIKVIELTEIMRQASDNPIIKYATDIRTNVLNNVYDKTDARLEWKSPEQLISSLKQYFDTSEFTKDSNYAKVLAYRNVTVDRYNQIIRELIYKKSNLPKILVGEQLIVDKPIMTFDFVLNAWVMVIPTNEELEVLNVLENNADYQIKVNVLQQVPYTFLTADEAMEYGWHKFDAITKQQIENHKFHIPLTIQIAEWKEETYKFKVYKCDVACMINDVVTKRTIDILHESSEKDFSALLNILKQSALKTTDQKIRGKIWGQYYELQNHFAWTKYNYAITVHKSQGSTYTNCIMHKWDIETNFNKAEVQALKYVAATRAREKLIIVNTY